MDEIITLDHGGGGLLTSRLIEEIFLPAFANETLCALGDGAVLPFADAHMVCSTDSFVIRPRFFPGGDIGKLAVCGTLNDVYMAGGEARYMSLGLILEEGLPIEELRRIAASMGQCARENGICIVTGDTKVVEKGRGDGIYINTTGFGPLRRAGLSPMAMREGDAILVSGFLGDHGAAVLLARGELGLLPGPEAEILCSDCAPLGALCKALWPLEGALRVLRDPTRGGLATVLAEFAAQSGLCMELEEDALPVRESTQSVCALLGLDPLYSANEGKLVAVVEAGRAEEALQRMQNAPQGQDAAIVGRVSRRSPGRAVVHTRAGGTRILKRRAGRDLPRIC